MRRSSTCVILVAGMALWTAAPAAAQLMIPDSGAGDRIMLFDANDGSLIDPSWISDAGQPWAFTTPKEARVVGSEIWVADQVVDAVHRFDMSRAYLGSITAHPMGGNLDNIRGFGTDGRNVYLTIYHATSQMRGVATYDTAGNPIGFFPSTASLFDAEPFDGDLLISNSTTDNIERYATSGGFLGVFATGVDFPQQVEILADNSVLTVSSIASPGVEGVYHFNPDGSLRRYIDTELLKGMIGEHVPRGAWLLGNGDYLLSTSKGVYTYDPAENTFTEKLAGVDAQYIAPIPEPASLALLLLPLAALLRRR